MSDVIIQHTNELDAGEIADWLHEETGTRFIVTTDAHKIIVHDRPRQIKKTEIAQLEILLEGWQARRDEIDATAADELAAIAELRDKIENKSQLSETESVAALRFMMRREL
jgi:hypothetical protein